VFDRFAHDGDGIGLGLAISQALAEVQSGSIALSDRPGGGTLATVTLPAAP
jgi:signal transduction histidine kinase